MKKRNIIFKTCIFCFIIIIVFFSLNSIFSSGYERITKQRLNDFYSEEHSLDAIFIGSSRVYYSFQAPIAFEESGITAMSYAMAGLPGEYFKYCVEEINENNDVNLYIINLTDFLLDENEMIKYEMLCYTPNSLHKLQFINNNIGWNPSECIPLLHFKDRWKNLNQLDFRVLDRTTTKTGFFDSVEYNNAYFTLQLQEGQGMHIYSDDISSVEVTSDFSDELISFIKYMQTNNYNFLFVIPPSLIDAGEIKYLKELCIDNGCNVLDGNEKNIYDTIGLQLQDYRDVTHLNYFGAEKFSRYLANYLVENYNYQDKRELSEYEDWRIETNHYFEIVDNIMEEIQESNTIN